MKIELSDDKVLSICYCDLCKEIGGKFQIKDKKNKNIYLRSGEQIAQLVIDEQNREEWK